MLLYPVRIIFLLFKLTFNNNTTKASKASTCTNINITQTRISIKCKMAAVKWFPTVPSGSVAIIIASVTPYSYREKLSDQPAKAKSV